MSTRSVIVRLEAEVGKYVAGMGSAATATDNVARKVANSRKSVADNSAAMEKAGGTLLKAGAVTVGALGAMTKASMDWETAWTGVKKTVDGTPAQLNAVEKGLRGLAKTLPTSHQEIAAVAEAAGQLGIQTPNVVAFTKTMIDLGQSTNLSAEDAATGLARFSNVMGTSQSDVGKLGATLVGLGNNFATTESEILAMSMRLAGVGHQIGLSEGQVMGLAAAMSSVGIDAEAGGTAMSMVMKKISAAVDEGGDDMDQFAKISGMSSEQFSTAWKKDAGGALVSFTEGLGKAQASGESVNQMLGDLGIKGVRETDALLRLSGAGELMGKAMTQGAQEYVKGTALIEEANKRYATNASKIAVSWNKIKDAAIDGGAAILPVVTAIVQAVAGLASTFGGLPAPVQSSIVVLAGIAGGAALVSGGLLVLIPRVAATRLAFKELNLAGSKVPGMMGKVGKSTGTAMAAMIAIGLAVKAGNAIWGEAAPSAEKFGQALLSAGDDSKELDKAFSQSSSAVVDGIDGIGDATMRFSDFNWYDKISLSASDALGITNKMSKIRDGMQAVDGQMAQLAQSGDFEAVGKNFNTIAHEAALSAEKQGKQALSTGELLDLMPEYKSALQAAATAAGVQLTEQDLLNFALGKTPAAMAAATTGADALKAGLDETGVSVDAVVEDMEKFLDLLFKTGMLTMSARDAQVAYQGALRDIDGAIKTVNDSAGKMGNMLNKNKTDFDLTTEAGAAGNAAFQALARGGMSEVEALSKSGAGQPELQKKLSQTAVDLEKAANKFGITGDSAKALVREILGVPKGVSIDSWMSDRAKKIAEGTKQAIDNIPSFKDIYVTTHNNSIFTEHHATGVGGSGGLQRAAGGAVQGPGTSTSDSIPARLSNGEHVLTAQDVMAMGGQSGVYRFRAGLHKDDGGQKLAGGGAVASRGSMYSPPRAYASSAAGPVTNSQTIHIDAAPGVAYQYAKDVAIQAATRAKDYQRAYGN